MKIENDMVIRHIANETVLVPTGKAAINNPGIITLTESGELLVRRLQEGCEQEDLVECLMQEYDVDRERAGQDVAAFLDKLRERGLL